MFFMKNLLYYTLIYVLLSFFTGVLNFFLHTEHWIVCLLSIILLGSGSYVLDTFRVNIAQINSKITYIERSFICLKSKYYYKSLLLKIALTLMGSYCLYSLFNIEDNKHIIMLFLCLFIIVYVNVLPVFFIIVDTRFLILYLKKNGSKNIHFEKCNKTKSACYLSYRDFKKIILFND